MTSHSTTCGLRVSFVAFVEKSDLECLLSFAHGRNIIDITPVQRVNFSGSLVQLEDKHEKYVRSKFRLCCIFLLCIETRRSVEFCFLRFQSSDDFVHAIQFQK